MLQLSGKDIEGIAERLGPVTDEACEATYIALAIKTAIESDRFRELFGAYGVAVLTQYAVNSRDKED